MTLNDAQAQKTYTISDICGNGNERRRLLDMGFTPETKVDVLTRAPLGGTVLVSLRNFTVALREDAAALVVLKGRV